MGHEAMSHPIQLCVKLLSRFVQDLRAKEVLEVLVIASVALAVWALIIVTRAESGNHIVGSQGCTVGEDYALLEGAGPLGGIGVARAFFSQIGYRSGRTPIEFIQLAEELDAGTQGVAVSLIRA